MSKLSEVKVPLRDVILNLIVDYEEEVYDLNGVVDEIMATIEEVREGKYDKDGNFVG